MVVSNVLKIHNPGYVLPATIYLENKVDGPSFTYTGLGTILSVDDAVFVETGLPRYIVAGRYWDGAAWSVSNGTFAQASDSATVIANLTAFNAAGAEFIPWSVVFGASNTKGSIDSFQVEVTGQILAPSGSIITNSYFVSNKINGFEATFNIPAGDYLGFYAIVGLTSKLYHDGTNWVESNGNSQAQTNTYADFKANIGILIANNVQVQLGIYMESGDQSTSPTIDEAFFEHNFGALKPSDPLRCNVYMYLTDLEGEVLEGIKVNVRLMRESTQYAEASSFVVLGNLQKTSDDEGFVSFRLVRSSEYETEADPMKYVIDFDLGDKKVVNLTTFDVDGNPVPIEFEVPDLESVNITDKVIAL